MIRLQFSRQADLVSDVIAWFTQGEFSHVDAIVYNDLLVGARTDHDPGVHARSSNYAVWAKKTVFDIPCTLEQFIRFNDFLLDQLGKPYDHVAILGFVFGRDWKQPDSWICSELQAAALEYAGIWKPYVAANKISPDALALAVSAIPGVQIVS